MYKRDYKATYTYSTIYICKISLYVAICIYNNFITGGRTNFLLGMRDRSWRWQSLCLFLKNGLDFGNLIEDILE